MSSSINVLRPLLRYFPRLIKVKTVKIRFSTSFSVTTLGNNFNLLQNNLVPNHISSTFVRYYAKGKDKKKDKGKGKVQINDSMLAEVLDVQVLKEQMQESIEALKEDFVKHLSLRSSSGSIESLKVNVDGEEHTIQELSQVVRKNPKTVVINLAVFPQAIPAVTKALRESGMNLNPQQDGTTLYVPVPKVTKEHRENLAKNAKAMFTKCKDRIKGVQVKFVKSVKKKEGVSADVLRNVEQQIVAIADGYVAEAETVTKSKQSELVGGD